MVGLLAGCASGERTAPAPEPAVVPSLVGVAVERAVADVQGAGLRPELVVGSPSPSPLPLGACDGGRVAAQDEAAGTQLVRGSTLLLTVVACPGVTASPP